MDDELDIITLADIAEPAVLIRINQTYRPGMSAQALYEATRGIWKVGQNRERAQYAFSLYQGAVLEVYRIRRWLPAGTLPYATRRSAHFRAETDRFEFEGEPDPEMHDKYVDRIVDGPELRSSSPVLYVNC